MGLLENEFGSLYVMNLFGANSINQQKYFIVKIQKLMFISKIEILENKEDEYNKNNLERDVELPQCVAMSKFFIQ